MKASAGVGGVEAVQHQVSPTRQAGWASSDYQTGPKSTGITQGTDTAVQHFLCFSTLFPH